MYNWLFFFVPFILFLVISPLIASASEVSVGIWHVTGSELWRTTFPLHTTVVDGASELSYPHASNYVVVNFENKLSARQSLAIEGGIIAGATNKVGSDSDWDTSQSNALWYYGQFNTKSKGSFITINCKQQTKDHTTFLYGYTYNTNDYSMTDGTYSIANYTAVNEPLPTLNSHYSISYQGPHVGIVHNIPLSNSLIAIGSLSYTPWALAQGYGWWNLRDLSFNHIGSAQMLDTSIGLRFSATPQNTSFTFGYRYQTFILHSGWEDSNSAISWSKATAVRQGYFFAGERTF